ncbi:DUF4172 domain-containing protein [Chitinophaga sp. LS1]|uniref:DUF4172 domain-containing protein n=1 Tax=Chitinophaga sp. LS1 TaxID=3051176 RepID=UPI002AABB670|nr:DUF4172 domain-containing protein [Chitinophaga sp. LS1]WPV64838.1 DUF4172 domain-containing protein [Chitinophaga sp. LS1]
MSYIYIYQLKDWPHFQWDKEAITEIRANVRFRQGRRLGSMESLSFNLQDEATLETLTLDVIKSSDVPEANRYIYRKPK